MGEAKDTADWCLAAWRYIVLVRKFVWRPVVDLPHKAYAAGAISLFT